MSDPGIGHNGAVTAEQKKKLRTYVSRIDALQDERKALGDDIRDIYHEAADAGFLPEAIRHCIRMQRMEAAKRARLETAIAQYELALEPVDPPKATLPDVDTSNPPFIDEIPENLRRT